MADAPRLEGRNVILVPFGPDHLTRRYAGWLNDPSVVRFSENRHRAHDVESCRRYVESFRESPHYLWAITDRGSGQHVGNLTATVDLPNGLADMAILIGEKSVWGRGVGREAWELAKTFLLRRARIRKIEAGAMSENTAMVHICKACGMQDEGRRPRHFVLDGRFVDLIQFGIFAE
jgi:[ribosomal protein S5]-alanine N-acetyltransferase